MGTQIPKASDLYRDDINEAIIQVQKATGIEIDETWWNANIGNNGTSEEILERFDRAYAEEIAKRVSGK